MNEQTMNEQTSNQTSLKMAAPEGPRGTHRGRLTVVAAVALALLASVGCGSQLKVNGQGTGQGTSIYHGTINHGGTTASGSQLSSDFFSGNTSDGPDTLAAKLGCTDPSGNPQLDRYVSAELDCLLDGDNDVSIFYFSSSANEQAWFALGPQSADDSGLVVLGDGWAIEPFNSGQASLIQGVVGGQIQRQS